MPLYEYKCSGCGCRKEVLVRKPDEAKLQIQCPECDQQMIRLFPLPIVNVFNEHFEPAVHTKWNWNPERAMSEVPGGGAEYARSYTEHRKGYSRWDINGDPNLPNIPTELKGTIEDQRRRGLFKNVHKQRQTHGLPDKSTHA